MGINAGMCGNVFVLCQPRWPGQTPIPHHHFDNSNPFLDVTSGMVKDPADVLDRQKCLDALAALRHAKWFQVRNIILLSSCSLMRCLCLFICVLHIWFSFYYNDENYYYLKQKKYSRMPPITTRIWLMSICIDYKSKLIWSSYMKNIL